MRVLFWNILHGGGPGRTPEILLALLEQSADVIALCEFRVARGSQLRGALLDHGYEFQVVSHRAGRSNGMLVASREALEVLPEAQMAGREIDVRCKNLYITAVHIADDGQPTLKAAHWSRLTGLARQRREVPHLLIGDLNTQRDGLPRTGKTRAIGIRCSRELGQLASLGYADLWLRQHKAAAAAEAVCEGSCNAGTLPACDEGELPTWRDAFGNGHRLDAAFASPALARQPTRAQHLTGFRSGGMSDHSAVLVEMGAQT